MPGWSRLQKETQLRNLYYSPGDPGSLGGIDRLYRRARDVGLPVSRKDVKNFLAGQLTYTLHRQVRKHFPRNKTYAGFVDRQWQADLADMQKLSTHNDNYRYILTCVDVLSRFAWAIPVKSKQSKDMRIAMKTLLRQSKPRVPERLQTDKGTEFFNREVSSFLRSKKIHHFASESDTKAAIVERFNRTLKTRIWSHFTSKNTKTYINVLNDIVHAYNHTVHRSHGMKPADVTEKDGTAALAWRRLYYFPAKPARRETLPVGSDVRIAKYKGNFEKGYQGNWSKESFKVSDVGKHPRKIYKLVDALGEPIKGSFYREEAQPITQNTLHVEEVIKRRRNGQGRIEHLVKWQGLPTKFNTWLSTEKLRTYRQLAPADADISEETSERDGTKLFHRRD
jgi:transposase InsO family protein